jgi:hypothetical protein
MDARKLEAKGVKTVSAFNFKRQDRFVHAQYVLRGGELASVTATGHLEVLRLEPVVPGELPIFSVRWDERANTIDVDLIGDPQEAKLFKRGACGYYGHHCETASTAPRTFKVSLGARWLRLYEGFLTFNIGLSAQVKDEFRLEDSISASCEVVPERK